VKHFAAQFLLHWEVIPLQFNNKAALYFCRDVSERDNLVCVVFLAKIKGGK
jgi:hypothetical protein